MEYQKEVSFIGVGGKLCSLMPDDAVAIDHGIDEVKYTRTDLAQSLADALEAFIPRPEVLNEMREVYEANKHQCEPGILDHIDNALSALANYRKGE